MRAFAGTFAGVVAVSAAAGTLAVGCGEAAPLDVELPSGAYAVWDESTPTGDGQVESEPLVDAQALDEDFLPNEGARVIPSLQTLRRPELPTIFGEDFLTVSEQTASNLPPSLCVGETEACGGWLEGDWVVDESCDASKDDPDTLWRWGQRMLNLRGEVCQTAVKGLSTYWTGALNFHSNVSTDERREVNTLRTVLGPECLTTTLRSNSTVQTSEGSCRAVQDRADEATVCRYEPGRCVCTSTSYREGEGTGLYRYDDNTVSISNQSTGTSPPPYRFCMEEGDSMIWWEPDTGDRLVLRRKNASPRTLNLPTEISVRAPR